MIYPNPIANITAQIANGTRFGVDLCLQRVRLAYQAGIPGLGGTAYQAWIRAGGAAGPNTHTVKPAPAGVPIFYKGSGNAGHVAVSAGIHAGEPWIYTTDFDVNRPGHLTGRWALVRERDLMRGWNMRRLGWSETLNGVRIHPHV